jgi:hypothetical protein
MSPLAIPLWFVTIKRTKSPNAAQSRKRLGVEINSPNVSKSPHILDQGAVAIKEDGWLLHARDFR